MVSPFALILCASLAQTPPPLPEDRAPTAESPEGARALAFADWLLEEGDHYRAIGEYKRSLFLDPRGPNADTARMRIGLAYLRGGQADAAAQHYRRIGSELAAPLRPEAALQVGYARYVGGQMGIAYEDLNGWLSRFADQAPEATTQRARYLLGWTQLELAEDTQAAATFGAVVLPSPTDQAELLMRVRRFQHLPQKSPVLAGILSIVPGAGHVYIEQPLIGLTALIWNGLFAFALYEAITQKQVGIAIALGAFEAMWYSGSIFGAVNGAMKFNRDARRNALEDLRERFDDRPESWPPAPPRAVPGSTPP